MKRSSKKLFLLFLLYFNFLPAVTLVYNLRVRRIFNIPVVLERIKRRLLVSAVPIFFARNSHIVNPTTLLDVCEKRRAGGSLLNLRYVPSKHWWFEATTAIETDRGEFTGTDPLCASRTGFDDVVLAGGYRHFFGDKNQCVLYAVGGLPTRRKVTLGDRFTPFVGTRFYNVGGGLEFSHSFISELRRSFSAILQGRFIHAFNRCWFPILPQNAEIQPGNFSDFLFVLQFRERRTIIETGYDVTFFSHQAIVLPKQKIETDTFVRHSVYLSVAHGWFKALFNKPLIIGTGFNVNYSKRFDAKTFTGWVFGTIVF